MRYWTYPFRVTGLPEPYITQSKPCLGDDCHGELLFYPLEEGALGELLPVIAVKSGELEGLYRCSDRYTLSYIGTVIDDPGTDLIDIGAEQGILSLGSQGCQDSANLFLSGESELVIDHPIYHCLILLGGEILVGDDEQAALIHIRRRHRLTPRTSPADCPLRACVRARLEDVETLVVVERSVAIIEHEDPMIAIVVHLVVQIERGDMARLSVKPARLFGNRCRQYLLCLVALAKARRAAHEEMADRALRQSLE